MTPHRDPAFGPMTPQDWDAYDYYLGLQADLHLDREDRDRPDPETPDDGPDAPLLMSAGLGGYDPDDPDTWF